MTLTSIGPRRGKLGAGGGGGGGGGDGERWDVQEARVREVYTSKVLVSQMVKIDAAIANLASQGHTVPRAAQRFIEEEAASASRRRAPDGR